MAVVYVIDTALKRRPSTNLLRDQFFAFVLAVVANRL
jgi:hypothetical protein